MPDLDYNPDVLDDCEEFLRRYYRDDIGELAQKYPNDQRSLVVDWMDLYRYDDVLAEEFRDKPDQLQDHLEYVLPEIDIPVDIDLSDAHVRVQLPKRLARQVGEYSPSDQRGRYLNVFGQVSKVTPVKPLPKRVVFDCKRCGTPNIVPQPGDDLQEPHECEGCERQGPFEARPNHQKSEFVDYQQALVQQPPEQTDGTEGRTINVRLHDDLTESVDPGDRVNLSGQFCIEPPENGGGWHQYIRGGSTDVEQTDYDEIDISAHKEEIEAIAAGEYGDPYELGVQSIAPKIKGYDTIKEAILLQMFGGVRVEFPDGTHGRGDSHILLLGDPGTAKSSLLRAVEELAPRSAYASGKQSSAAGLTASVVPDTDFGDSKWSLEAGALVLANKGVACIDEIDKMDEEAVSSMHDALEAQRVTINKADFQNVKLPAVTSLLAAGNPKHGRFDRHEPIGDQIDLAPALMSRFDLMFMLTDVPDEEWDRDVAGSQIQDRNTAKRLEENKDVTDEAVEEIEPAIDHNVLRAYIAYAKRLTPTIEDDSVFKAMRDYFTNLRIANGEGEDAVVPVTHRKLEAIERLAEASARIRLSETIELQDVKRANRIVGESLSQVGVDEEGGTFDVDIIETGTSHTQRERFKTVKNIVQELQKDGSTRGASIEEVYEIASEEHDIDESGTEHALQHHRDNGDMYKPNDGEIRLV